MVCRADGFRCLADIVVATPGRLVDHIDQTPGFSLQQLRFLVGHRLDIEPLAGVISTGSLHPALALVCYRSLMRLTG